MSRIKVYCPDCARQVYDFDGIHTSSVNLKCKCGLYLRYIAKENRIIKINKPVRNTSSGARFW